MGASRRRELHAVRNALALALAACATLGACTDEPVAPPAPGADDVSVLRTPQPPDQRSPEFTRRIVAEGQRAQAFLDEQIVPKLDRALRETGKVSYAQLQAEVAAIVRSADPEVIKAGLDRFFSARGEVIEAAMARLGTTTAELADQIRSAATAGEPAHAIAAKPPGPQPFGACSTGFEFEPFPPYFQTGNWFWGVNSAFLPTADVNGTIHSESYAITGASGVGGWVRADNIPPSGAGTTTVSTLVSFPTNLSELLLWVPAYVGSGVGLTIEIYDGGANGPLLASCRTPLIDRSLPIGYLFDNRPTSVFHACTVHHASSSFLTAKVHVDTYGTNFAPFGGFARAVADASVQTIRYSTCLD